MKKQIVFTEDEWRIFRTQLGIELGKEMGRYTVTSKEDGSNVDDGKSLNFWVGIGIIAIDEALKT